MALLHELFPGLIDWEGELVPDWSSLEYPWEIIHDTDYGIVSQISEILEGDEVLIHETTKISDFVQIEGPSIIGPKAEIRHGAYLRKGSWICEGALVGHSTEVKNSILLPNSNAPHFNYIGDSILGFDCNIGAGVKLSNVRNDRKEIMVELVDGTRVNSRTHKLGAMIGDGSQIGCNVVTNPGSITPPKSMVFPNETVTGWLRARS